MKNSSIHKFVNYTKFYYAKLILKTDKLYSTGYEKEVKMAFKAIHNGGFITKVEIKKIYSRLGEDLTDKEVQLLLSTAGANSEGKINYKQFSTMMKGILEKQK